MNYRDILGEEINRYGTIKLSKLLEYHEYNEDVEDTIGSNNWIKNDKIYLDGNFDADQLGALSLFLREQTK